MTAVPPLLEQPYYSTYIQSGLTYSYESDDTAVERRPIAPNAVWIDIASIPAVPPVPSPWPGTASSIVTGISGVSMTAVVGDPYRLESVAGHFLNMVPATYADGAYRPTLVDATGRDVPYNPSIWVADGILQVIEFKYSTPTELGYTLPMSLTYWSYTGAIAGAGSGFVTAGANDGAGAGIYSSTIGSIMHFKSLATGTGISTSVGPNTITLTNTGVTSAVAGTGIGVSGATGAVTFSNTGVTSATAGAGINISAGTGAITISNTGVLTITNAGAGSSLVSAASGALKSLTAGTAISFVVTGTNITIDSTGVTDLTAGAGINISAGTGSITITNTGVLALSNAGAGSSLVSAASGALKSLTAGTAISFTATATDITINSTGVTDVIAGTGISVSAGTGSVTISLANQPASTILANATGAPAAPTGVAIGTTLAFTAGPTLTTVAMTGDVTTSADSFATTIANGAVSLAKMAALAANSVIGNTTGGAATPTAVPTSTFIQSVVFRSM